MAAVTPLIRKWRHWLKRIEQEQLQDLLINQHFFRQFKEHTEHHAGSLEHAEFAEWIAQSHAAFVATTIRRIVERPNRTWKSISLRILLEDMASNDSELTRSRFLDLYRGTSLSRFGDQDFNKIVRKKGAAKVSSSRINRDIKELERACEPVHRLVNKVIAHTEEDRRRIGKMRYRDFDTAIDKIVVTFQRYGLLLNGKTCVPLVAIEDYSISDSLSLLWPKS
jgi:hypothetical protein